MPKESKPRASKKEVTAKRAKKDPNAPKRPLSSYMLFTQDQRSIVQTENPGIAFGMVCSTLILTTGEVGKVLGEKWKALSEAEKKPYEDKAKAEKEKYVKVKADYDASSESLQVNGLTSE